MKAVYWAGCGTAFTFLMTALGAALVFFFKHRIDERVQRACMGFSGGVMAAAAVFSLLNPAVEQAGELGFTPWLVVTAGFLLGAGAIAGVDALLRRVQRVQRAGDAARRRMLMYAAVTLHNIPEGMAVGLAFALAAQGEGASAAAMALALGIGIQNFPEGAAVALPLRQGGMSRRRSFLLGVASGAVEPIFGVLAVLAATAMRPVMPPLMALSAGSMMLVVMGEMVPEAAQDHWGVGFAVIGYAAMMALDVALG